MLYLWAGPSYLVYEGAVYRSDGVDRHGLRSAGARCDVLAERAEGALPTELDFLNVAPEAARFR
jgi:hypothetical protein